MKILFFSNAPWANTGYGNQTDLFVPRIKELGHELTIAAVYGLSGAPRQFNDVWVLPSGRDAHGNDIMAADAEYLKADIVITLYDTWIFQNVVTSRIKWFPWMPVDHQPTPPSVVQALQTCQRPIAYSKFGIEELRKSGFDPYYVPHGIDTKALYPMDKREAREKLGTKKDVFLVGMVAANKGNPSRKCFDQQIRAFAEFARDKEDVMLYLHTDMQGINNGENITQIIKLAGIPENKIGVVDDYRYRRGMLNTEYMCTAYSAMDVLMNASRGEGFGIPIIEAQACGTPVIVTDFSAMPELVDWGDWAVPYTDFHFSQNSYQATPSVPEITKRLQYVYDNRDSEEIAQEARNNALKYDADLVTEYYWKPVLDDIAETLERDAARLNQVEIPAAKDV